ncbi:GNAT family N-acetyltransferase [Bacillus marinisedimentorum]|uniref:GNAT family N-acetyltransferase n=1 Tax=Bacillus marinisedimentorum TaxID=1821260 RepID=UPI000872CAE0|nr:GNAT family N-acetyltransferase [Bacillus marinisedimentorum]
MIELRKMSDCTFSEALQAWNKGFEGYYLDMTMEIGPFLKRMVNEDLSPEYSWIVFSEGSPAGLILSGIRTINGEKRSWNGGTGLAPELRAKGTGRLLVEKSLETYEENSVDVCFLEAIADNSPAISLYKKMGYEVVDGLIFFQNRNSLDDAAFKTITDYRVEHIPVHETANLDFYEAENSWQTLYQSVKCGKAVIAYDDQNEAAGYALFTTQYKDSGELAAITLYQCETKPGRNDEQPILNSLLSAVFSPNSEKCVRSTVNTSKKSTSLIDILKRSGFTAAIEQVHMKKTLQPTE